MSNDFGPPNHNPFQDHSQFNAPNPYASSPFAPSTSKADQLVQAVSLKVRAPAIALLVVCLLGLAASIFNVVYALIGEPGPVDPNAPQFAQEMVKGSVGPVAVAIQSVFVVVNLIILMASIQMMRFKTRGLALTGSILAMLNIGTCCCLVGLPVGIWSLVILLQPDVTEAFRISSQ